jgi:alkylation response protein AidB-like acyl-CoA dehydrogenase
MLDESVAYAKERVQFGKPIGSFQAVKHRCADMLVDVEGMRSAVWWAAWCVATDHDEADVAVATAKSWCSEAGVRVCQSALQIHGGIGFTWDCDVHLYLKRARFDADAFGSAGQHLSALGALLRAKVEAGQPVL